MRVTGTDKYPAREPGTTVSHLDFLPQIPKGPAGAAVGICAIILGIVALVFPVIVFSILAIFFSLFAIILSAGLIRSGLTDTGESRIHRLILLTFGTIGILLAILVYVAPRFLNILAKDIFGIWAIILGLGCIQYVFATETGIERWINGLSGIVLFLVGVLIFIAPALFSDYLLLTVLGVFAIITGAFTLWFSRSDSGEKPEINHAIYK
jgi:uncharacterized membrane protein HdeD (DUF308 family)